MRGTEYEIQRACVYGRTHRFKRPTLSAGKLPTFINRILLLLLLLLYRYLNYYVR